VADDIQAAGEAVQELVPVSKNHLHSGGIPEGVFILLPKMHGADDVHVLVVDALPVELLQVEVENPSNVVVGIVGSLVLDGLLTLNPNDCAREILLIRVILGVVHRAVKARGRLGLGRGLGLRGRGRWCSLLCLLFRGNSLLILRNHASGVLDVGPGTVPGLLVNVFGFGNVLEENLRDNGLLLGGSLLGGSTRRTRLAQGIKPFASLAHKVPAVAQRVAGTLAFLFSNCFILTLRDTPKQIWGYDRANVGRHLLIAKYIY
jgi:hypothetical protein